MNIHAIGHNNPPDPLEDAIEPFLPYIEEAGNWADGTFVENKQQMEAVDALIKALRPAKAILKDSRLKATLPLRQAVKDENDRWGVYEKDVETRLDTLVAAVAPFKKKLADRVEAEKRAAFEEARRKEAQAQKAAAEANPANYEAQVEATRLKQEALDAKKAASTASKQKVKGMRPVHHYQINDERKALHWIAINDRESLANFVEEYVRKNHTKHPISGVDSWTTKEPF